MKNLVDTSFSPGHISSDADIVVDHEHDDEKSFHDYDDNTDDVNYFSKTHDDDSLKTNEHVHTTPTMKPFLVDVDAFSQIPENYSFQTQSSQPSRHTTPRTHECNHIH